MQLDILAFASHPDDVELSCSGTLLKHLSCGSRVGVVDLTKGELGTRGNAEIRARESAEATRLMGLSVRENLGFADGFFSNDRNHLIPVIEMIRKYRPRIVLANAVSDRHPDHGRGARLVAEACFLSGLRKIDTKNAGSLQEAWRPQRLYHYIQDRYIKPDFVIDITPFMEKKMEVIKAFGSQFFDPSSNEPVTPISTPEFLEFLYARASDHGRIINVRYGEGFTAERAIGISNLDSIF
jgi:N-acetylglucosamine malate deacetylase 1